MSVRKSTQQLGALGGVSRAWVIGTQLFTRAVNAGIR